MRKAPSRAPPVRATGSWPKQTEAGYSFDEIGDLSQLGQAKILRAIQLRNSIDRAAAGGKWWTSGSSTQLIETRTQWSKKIAFGCNRLAAIPASVPTINWLLSHPSCRQ